MAAAALFFIVRAPLLTPDGLLRGVNSDSAIIGLMGRKMFEGRGFDVFFWGQNYLGSFTSMVAALFAFVVGSCGPLALRLAAMSEVALGALLYWWAIRRIDGRAAAVVLLMLAVGPPDLFSMSVTPIGGEMAFLFAAAIAAVAVQHFTSARSWLLRWRGQFAFGVLIGFAWWMNQQVVFTLLAFACALFFRSPAFAGVREQLALRDRLLLRSERLGWRPLNGYAEAFVFVIHATGAVMLVVYVITALRGQPLALAIFGPMLDPLLLIFVPHIVLPLTQGEWRRWRGMFDWRLLRVLAPLGAGFAIGRAPVWLGRWLHWYEPNFSFYFAPEPPDYVVAHVRELVTHTVKPWLGIAPSFAGVLFAIALVVLVVIAVLRRSREDAVLFLALVPLINVAFYVITNSKTYYLITATAPLYALAVLGALLLCDSRRLLLAIAAACAALVGSLSLASATLPLRNSIVRQPDPRADIRAARAAQCRVVYADYWVSYRSTFLGGPDIAWVTYGSYDRSPHDSAAARALPGRHCLLEGNQLKVLATPPPRDRLPRHSGQ